MSILQNAIDSIQIGVEDFSSTDERRSVSAIRNIAAGMLLLFKEKLCRLSPDYDNELLIKKDIEPEAGADGGLVFKGRGKKTVDVFQIRERFQSMKVEVDWKRLDEITNLRSRPCKIRFSKSALRGVTENQFFDDHDSDPIVHTCSPHAPRRIV
jgi:hypothetical protein